MSAQAGFARLARTDGRAALVTVLAGQRAGERLLVGPEGVLTGELSDAGMRAEALAAAAELLWAERSERRGDLFIDVIAPPPRLLIFGAVEYASHLSRIAHGTGWHPYVIDPRGAFASPQRFPDAVEVVVAWPAAAVKQLGGIDRATYIAVLTHDPKIDDEVLQLALAADPAYIGAMGSARAQLKRRERLLAAGVAERELARISAPIGLDLGALSSEEVAVSVMAEVIAVRHGRSGGRLSARSDLAAAEVGGRIH